MQPVIDPMTGAPAVDPMTGEPMMQPVPIPGAEKAFTFDVDWLVDVRLDNQSAADKDQEITKEVGIIQLGQAMGVQFDPQRTITYLAHKQGFEEIEELYLTPEEVQQQQSQMMMQQDQMMQQQQQQVQGEQQMQAQEADKGRNHELVLETMKQQGPLLGV
jgi:hypothetical protein